MTQAEKLYECALRADQWDLIVLCLARDRTLADGGSPSPNTIDWLARLYLSRRLAETIDTIQANVPEAGI